MPAPAAPLLQSISRENNALILKFSGDAIADGAEGFAVAGRDLQVYRAQAELIDEHTLKVYSADVAEPFAVWYAWADNPEKHSFKTVSGEQAFPFRASIDSTSPVGKNLL